MSCRSSGECLRSALTLLVAQVLADHHDPTVTADHLALVADLLDARLNLHLLFLSWFRDELLDGPKARLPRNGVPRNKG